MWILWLLAQFGGTIFATGHNVPRVERRIALPDLKTMGNNGITFAAIGGVYIGIEQLVQKYRTKRDFVNGAVVGASYFGLRR